MGLRQVSRWASAVSFVALLGCGDDKTKDKDAGRPDRDASTVEDAGGDAQAEDAGIVGPETLCAAPYKGTPWKSADLLADGPFEIGKQTLQLVDPTRKVPANNEYEGADQRTLNTLVWYPAKAEGGLAEGGPFPLFVWSHGFTSSNGEVSYMAELLASRGYVVAAPNFPLASFTAPGGPTSKDFENLPGDVKFVIDSMLAKSEDAADVLYTGIDPERIAAGGLSMGSGVTLFVSFHANVLDERVKATVVLAGNGISYQKLFYETRKKLPLLIMHGDLDAVLPYDPCGTSLRDRAGSPTWFMTIKKGSHAGFAGYSSSVDGNPDELGCATIATADPNRPSSDDTLTRLGGAEVGIVVPKDKPKACTIDPLPKSVSGKRQQELTGPVVYAFLESVFAQDEDTRNAGCQYVEQGALEQNEELSITLR
jgi:dienelactone hydrolase